MFSFSFNFMNFKIYFLISTTYWRFKGILFNLYLLVCFLCLPFLLISHFISLWSDKMNCHLPAPPSLPQIMGILPSGITSKTNISSMLNLHGIKLAIHGSSICMYINVSLSTSPEHLLLAVVGDEHGESQLVVEQCIRDSEILIPIHIAILHSFLPGLRGHCRRVLWKIVKSQVWVQGNTVFQTQKGKLHIRAYCSWVSMPNTCASWR